MAIKDFWDSWGDLLLTSFGFVVMAGVVPVLALFIGRGGEETNAMTSFTFYSALGGLFLAGLIVLRIGENLSKNNLSMYERIGWMNALIYDQEKGILTENPSRRIHLRTYVMFSIVLFSIFGVVATATNTWFVAIPNIEQQATSTAKVLLTAEPASSVETAVFLFIISVLYGLTKWFEKRRVISSTVSKIILVAGVIPVMTLFWAGFHLLRYGAQETNLIATAFFGFTGAFTIIMFGTFLPWYIFHFINNSFAKMSELFSNELVTIIVSIAVLITIAVWIAIELQKKKSQQFEDFKL